MKRFFILLLFSMLSHSLYGASVVDEGLDITIAFKTAKFFNCKKLLVVDLVSLSGKSNIVDELNRLQLSCFTGLTTQQDVEKKLNSALKQEELGYSIRWQWKGAQKVLFSSSLDSSIELKLQRIGTEFLNKQLSMVSAKDVTISMQSVRNRGVKERDIEFLGVDYGYGCALSHKSCLLFQFRDKQGKHYRLTRRFDISARVTSAVASQKITQASLISQGVCEVKFVPIYLLKEPPIKDCETIYGMQSKKKYNQNQVFELSQLSTAPLVQKGEEVMVQIQHGSVTIEAEGVAWTSASLGEVVLVSLKQNNLPFSAIVKKKGWVIIDEE